jgi:hypothetical protein
MPGEIVWGDPAFQPLPNSSLICHRDGLFPNFTYGPFPNPPSLEAKPVEPGQEHVSPGQTDYNNLLSKAEETLRRQVANKTNKLYTKQGPDLSKAFLSALCALPTESFNRL